MSQPNERSWNMLKRLIRYLVGHGRLVQVISEQRYVKAPRVDTATMQDAHLPERVRQELTFFMASTFSKLEVARRVHEV